MEFKIPESLDGLSLEDVRQLIANAKEAGRGLASISDADITKEQSDKMIAIANFIGEANEVVATAEAHAQQVAAARGAFAEPEAEVEAEAGDPEEDEAEEAEEQPTEDEGEEEVSETNAVEDAVAEAQAEAEIIEEAEEAEAEEQSDEVAEDVVVEEPVLAAAKPSLSSIARQAPTINKEEKVEKQKAAITASAGIPSIEVGTELNGIEGLTKAFLARSKSIGGGKNGRREHFSTATIGKFDENFEFSDKNPDFGSDGQALLDAVANEKRFGEGGLTAAAGWCAPSETLYDMCEIETRDGILDLPEINVSRGGLRFTKGPDFSDFYGGGFILTEDEVADGTEKSCVEIPCADFEEVRLDAVGLCITAPFLTNAAYPELVQRSVRGFLTAFAHQVNASVVGRIKTALGGTATTLSNIWPTASGLLGALELAAVAERQRFRMSLNATMEVVLPVWAKAAIRADLSNRAGVDLLAVTDAMIDEYFRVRQLSVQYVYGLQDLTIVSGSDSITPGAYPTAVEAFIYPAGTFVKASADVITLDTVYDSTNLKLNQYTALFAEEGLAVINRCHEGRYISIPVGPTGLAGAAILNNANGLVGPAYTPAGS